MIGIAALTLASLTPQAGTVFVCKRFVDSAQTHFRVFVPGSKAASAYRVEPGIFRAVESPGFEKIEDKLPERLDILWRRGHNSPVRLTVSGYDAAAGTANYGLSTERNPASALFTPVNVAGTCTARAATAADLQDLTK